MLELLRKGLYEHGFTVMTAADGEAGLEVATTHDFDAIVLDIGLPKLDGYQLMQSLRAKARMTPVLMLTARDAIRDRVRGLDTGADDYLVKPFAFSELAARVAALGRRPRRAPPDTRLKVADLEMDLLSRSVRRGGQTVELQPREYRLLECLMRHAEQVVTRTMLLELVWDLHFDPHTNVVETHISRLRGKIDRGQAATLIHTVRGAGYCLCASP